MTCTPISLPNGARAIVCGTRRRQRCKCGRPATLLCDWKLKQPATGRTCDKPLCESCATSPAPDKDLCPEHALAFGEWKARR
jgi:hypothetical protein